LDPRSIVLAPPTVLEAAPGAGVSIRPVHFQNIGSLAGQNPDAFWQAIYTFCKVDTNKVWNVQPFVEGQEVRAYYNCAFMACRPELGLFRAWRDAFEGLLSDPISRACVAGDTRHSVYFHQAVLSAVILAKLRQEQISILPPSYGYPLSVQSSIPIARRFEKLSQVSVALYEGSLSDCLAGISVGSEFETWLEEQASK